MPASRATSSTRSLASPLRPTHTIVAANSRSRVVGVIRLSFCLECLVVGDLPQGERIADDGDRREDEPLARVVQVGTLVELEVLERRREVPRLVGLLGLQLHVGG